MKFIHPDFAILVGDIIYGYGSDIPRLKMQWNDFLSVYDSFGIPVFVAPGNHEMQTEDAPESGNIDAQRLYIMHLGRLYYAFAYDNSLFIILDTDIVGSAGYDDGDYFDHFGGTSAACPQVAGVAALVLSANSALTSDEVQTILQKSADRIDRYAFDQNGWNEHVGHGRVNAHHAVLLALNDDGDVPLISHTPLQPTSSVDPQVATAIITDDQGIATGSRQPALFYRTIFQGDSSAWHKVVDQDGPTGDEYDFTIPAQSWGTEVEYYIRATDDAPDSLTATFPSYGKSQSAPPFLLHYFVGDFETLTFTSYSRRASRVSSGAKKWHLYMLSYRTPSCASIPTV